MMKGWDCTIGVCFKLVLCYQSVCCFLATVQQNHNAICAQTDKCVFFFTLHDCMVGFFLLFPKGEMKTFLVDQGADTTVVNSGTVTSITSALGSVISSLLNQIFVCE